MTVAAGFVCDDGIVICADTQETIPGYTKSDAHKLMAFQCPGINLIFAGAGNNATQIDETSYEIAGAITKKAPRGGDELKEVLRESLDRLFPKAYYPRQHGPEVDLLMAVQTKDEAALYRIADCNMAPVPAFASVGSGVVLSLQLLQRHYSKEIPITEAAIVCIYVLHHVKKWVDGCGGKTELVLVPNTAGRVVYMPSVDIEKFEKYSEAYDDAVKGLLLAVPRSPKNLTLFDKYMVETKNQLLMARTAFQEMEDTMREMAVHLGIDYEQMMRDSEAAANAFLSAKAPKPSDSRMLEDQQ